jgi:hypothetical protein
MASAWDQTPVDPNAPAAPSPAPQGSAWDATPSVLPQGLTGNAANGGKMAGLAQGAIDPFNGASQLLFNAESPTLQDATKASDKWLYEHTGGVFGMKPGTDLNQGISQQNAQYEADRKAAGRGGFDWMRTGGNIAATAPLAVATAGTAAPATLGGTVMNGAIGGAATSALSPVNDADPSKFWSEKGDQVKLGALLGGLGSGAARVVGGVLSPVLDKGQQFLVDHGVTMTPGQLIGGGAKRIEDAMTSVPVIGDFIKNAQRRSFQSLNDATINSALEPIGVNLPKGVSGREAIDFADKAISDAYSTTLNKIGAVRPDQQFGADIQNLAGMMQNVPKDKAAQFLSILKNEVADRMSNGVMTAEGFKAADSNLGQMARGYLRSQDYDTATMGAAIQQAQVSLRSMLERTAPPELSQALSNANKAFATFLRPQRAASMVGAEGGVFTPEQLQSAVKAMDQSKRKGAFASGNAMLQDLSDAAKTVMGNKVPDSGTPLRNATMMGVAALAGHSVLPPALASAAPLAAAGGAAATLPYTKLGQALLNKAVAAPRPAEIKMLAELLRRGAVPAGMAVAPTLSNASQP